MDISGFGYWELLGTEGLEDRCWGIIDLTRMIFIRTDENQNPTSLTYNLRLFKSWQKVNPPKD